MNRTISALLAIIILAVLSRYRLHWWLYERRIKSDIYASTYYVAFDMMRIPYNKRQKLDVKFTELARDIATIKNPPIQETIKALRDYGRMVQVDQDN